MAQLTPLSPTSWYYIFHPCEVLWCLRISAYMIYCLLILEIVISEREIFLFLSQFAPLSLCSRFTLCAVALRFMRLYCFHLIIMTILYMFSYLGKEMIVVIVHDFPRQSDEMRREVLANFKQHQRTTFQKAGLVIVCGNLAEKVDMNEEDWSGLEKYLKEKGIFKFSKKTVSILAWKGSILTDCIPSVSKKLTLLNILPNKKNWNISGAPAHFFSRPKFVVA